MRRCGLLLPAVCLALGLHTIAAAQGPGAEAADAEETVVFGSLMWATAINRQNTIWRTASRYCGALQAGGYDDWRLPTLAELESLYEPDSTAEYKIRSPLELDDCCVWSMTNLIDIVPPEIDTILDPPFLYAWGLMFDSGIRYYSAMHQVDGQTLCVRDEVSAAAEVPGEPAAEIELRGVVIDDLMWATGTNRRSTNWMTASTYCRELELDGFDDWRLPTLYELESIYVPDSDAQFRVHSPIHLESCCVWSTTNLEELSEPWHLETIRHEPWLNAWGLVFSTGIRYFSYMLQPDGEALCVRENT